MDYFPEPLFTPPASESDTSSAQLEHEHEPTPRNTPEPVAYPTEKSPSRGVNTHEGLTSPAPYLLKNLLNCFEQFATYHEQLGHISEAERAATAKELEGLAAKFKQPAVLPQSQVAVGSRAIPAAASLLPEAEDKQKSVGAEIARHDPIAHAAALEEKQGNAGSAPVAGRSFSQGPLPGIFSNGGGPPHFDEYDQTW